MKRVIVIVSLLVFGCTIKQSDGVITPTRLNGINGEASYMIDKKSNEVILVIKDEFLGKPYYHVEIKKDTLTLGETFEGFISLFKDNASITIDNPDFQQVLSEDSGPETREFQFTPKDTGIYNFTGVIKYDSTVVPFEYKFIVVIKK